MSKHTTIMALLLAGVMSLALFMISYQVQDLEDQLEGLNRDITRDSRAVHVLQAEWAHLNDPMRLRALSEKYLGLTPVATGQLGTVEDIPWREVREVSAPESTQPEAVLPEPAKAAVAKTQKAAQAAENAKPDDQTLAAIRRALGLPSKDSKAVSNIIPAGETR